MAETIKIAGELESTATGNVVAAASAIKDKVKNKYQSQINQETDAAIQAETERATAQENNRYTKSETYNKTELNNMITTPNQEYVTVNAYASLPARGSANTVYRVSNYDGSQSQVDPTKYSEYAWDGTQYVFLSVKTQIGEVFDISEYHSGAVYTDLADALGTSGVNVPSSIRRGGMSVKFKQLVSPASYTVVKTEGLDSQPTGTEISTDPHIDSGTYNESQLSAFSTLPESTGAGNAVTYWMEVAGDTTTYTSWVITMAQSSDNKYVQYRLMTDDWSIDADDWAVVPNIFETEIPEYFYAITDSKHRLFFGIKIDGSVTWIKGVPQPIKDYVENLISDLRSLREKVEVLDSLLYTKEDQEFFQLLLDKKRRVIESIDNNGKKTLNLDVFVAGKINDNDIHYENNVEYVAIIKDKNGKVFLAFRGNGEPEFGIKYPKFVIDTIINYLGDYQKFPIDFGMPKVSDSWLVVGDGCEGGMNPYCIALGKKVLANNTGIKNITVGYDNMYQCTGHDNTSMGYHASFRNTSGIANAAFGSESQDDNLGGGYNASIGFCSLQRNNDGSFNVAIGAFALQGGQNSHYEDDNHKSYNRNIAIGAYALVEALHTSRRNVAIGYGALRSSRVYVNNIAIGEEVDCDKDNQTVIGNDSTVETIVRGDLIVKGTDGIKRQIVFNQDGTCSWIQVN